MCLLTHVILYVHVEVKRQFAGFTFLPPPCGFWDQTQSSVWWQAPFLTELSYMSWNLVSAPRYCLITCIQLRIMFLGKSMILSSILDLPRDFSNKNICYLHFTVSIERQSQETSGDITEFFIWWSLYLLRIFLFYGLVLIVLNPLNSFCVQ